jgi:hypothetical protein
VREERESKKKFEKVLREWKTRELLRKTREKFLRGERLAESIFDF